MKSIEHWSGEGTIEVAESAGGVLATVDPFANLVSAGVSLRGRLLNSSSSCTQASAGEGRRSRTIGACGSTSGTTAISSL